MVDVGRDVGRLDEAPPKTILLDQQLAPDLLLVQVGGPRAPQEVEAALQQHAGRDRDRYQRAFTPLPRLRGGESPAGLSPGRPAVGAPAGRRLPRSHGRSRPGAAGGEPLLPRARRPRRPGYEAVCRRLPACRTSAAPPPAP